MYRRLIYVYEFLLFWVSHLHAPKERTPSCIHWKVNLFQTPTPLRTYMYICIYTILVIAAINIFYFFFLFQRTPLHIAAGKGYKYTLECLIKQGADINITDNDGVSTHVRHHYYWCCWFEFKLASSTGSTKPSNVSKPHPASCHLQYSLAAW